MAETLGLIVHSKVEDNLTDVAGEQRSISVVVTRKKKTTTDAIANVVNSLFP